jgi:hypothetical protein
MNIPAPDPFEQLIRDAGQGYLIDWYAPKTGALPHLVRLLDAADQQARERLGPHAPRLTPEHLIQEYQRNPHKVKAFLQVLASASPDMLVMVWRILQGMGVETIHLEYQAQSAFRLHVCLSSPCEHDTREEYESTDIDDAVVLRHLGIMKMNDRPLFDGFYALQLEAAQKKDASTDHV